MHTRLKPAGRRLRFFVLEKLVLPIATPLLRLLMGTWRKRGPDAPAVQHVMQAPRVVLTTFHGMLLHLLPFRHLVAAHGRRMVVMLSPSLDGRLLAATLGAFGIDHVYATSGSRGITGSREFIRRVEAGDVGIIAADGPRGPCCAAKRGFLQIAAAANAHVTLVISSAGRGITFGSWDRAHLPAPFAWVELSLQLLPPPASGDHQQALHAIQDTLLESARAMRSPILPPALRDRSPSLGAAFGK